MLYYSTKHAVCNCNWMDVIADNMTNVYTPGFKEKQVNFKTFLGGAINDDYNKKMSQGSLLLVHLMIMFSLKVKVFSLQKLLKEKVYILVLVNLHLMEKVSIELRMEYSSRIHSK